MSVEATTKRWGVYCHKWGNSRQELIYIGISADPHSECVEWCKAHELEWTTHTVDQVPDNSTIVFFTRPELAMGATE